MYKIIKIQLALFLLLSIVSLFAQGNIWLPIMMLLAIVIGPVMAYTYPHGMEGYIIITIGFIVAGILMFYGIKKQILTRGIVAFLLGFWIWVFIGLIAGLGTGT